MRVNLCGVMIETNKPYIQLPTGERISDVDLMLARPFRPQPIRGRRAHRKALQAAEDAALIGPYDWEAYIR